MNCLFKFKWFFANIRTKLQMIKSLDNQEDIIKIGYSCNDPVVGEAAIDMISDNAVQAFLKERLSFICSNCGKMTINNKEFLKQCKEHGIRVNHRTGELQAVSAGFVMENFFGDIENNIQKIKEKREKDFHDQKQALTKIIRDAGYQCPRCSKIFCHTCIAGAEICKNCGTKLKLNTQPKSESVNKELPRDRFIQSSVRLKNIFLFSFLLCAHLYFINIITYFNNLYPYQGVFLIFGVIICIVSLIALLANMRKIILNHSKYFKKFMLVVLIIYILAALNEFTMIVNNRLFRTSLKKYSEIYNDVSDTPYHRTEKRLPIKKGKFLIIKNRHMISGYHWKLDPEFRANTTDEINYIVFHSGNRKILLVVDINNHSVVFRQILSYADKKIDILKTVHDLTESRLFFEFQHLLNNSESKSPYKTGFESALDMGYDPDYRDENNNTVMMLAAEHDMHHVIGLLRNKGAKINLKNNEGRTALILAAINDSYRAVDLLIKRGADLNEIDHFGKSALLYAVENNNKDIAFLLGSNRADLTIKDNAGNTAAELIKKKWPVK